MKELYVGFLLLLLSILYLSHLNRETRRLVTVTMQAIERTGTTSSQG